MSAGRSRSSPRRGDPNHPRNDGINSHGAGHFSRRLPRAHDVVAPAGAHEVRKSINPAVRVTSRPLTQRVRTRSAAWPERARRSRRDCVGLSQTCGVERRCEIGVRREASDSSFTNDERRGAFGHCVGHLSRVHEPKRVIDGDHDRVTALKPGPRPKVDGCSVGLTVRELANGMKTTKRSATRDDLDVLVGQAYERLPVGCSKRTRSRVRDTDLRTITHDGAP
jgi:hypothetical protein